MRGPSQETGAAVIPILIMQILLLTVLTFAFASMYTFMRISFTQPKPYMDEIFHIPQAKEYCAGNFSSWDPMITTLPGLYLFSVGVIKPITVIMEGNMSTACSVYWLRAINILFAVGNFYLIYALLKKLHNPILDPRGIRLYMTTFALSIFPVLYFFTFLYYTDPGSTFFVLFMYLLHLHDSHMMAAVMAVVAILFRQTNIVWVIFVAGLTVRKNLILWLRETGQKSGKVKEEMTEFELLRITMELLWNSFRTRSGDLITLLLNILQDAWCYIFVGLGFVAFVIINDGIVVGARSHHSACLNFPQIYYFLCMTNFFALFHLITPWKLLEFLKFSFQKYLFIGIFIGISVILIHNFTYQHEYLLADNRHYAFYVWSKIYKRHEHIKFLLIPVYLYCSWSFTSELKHCDIFFKIIFFICLLMTTVPQKLLEFRYFILPYLIFRINCKYGSVVSLLHEILLYILVNVATVYIFLNKPFKWANSDSLQRFMW